MTDKKYIIALDQGTTSSRAVLLDHNANVVEIAQREFTQIYPRAGWVEHNPMEIWATQSSTLNEVVAKAGITSDEIAALGITNQRETTIVWEKATGTPVYNAIVWQCRRTADITDKLKADGHEEYIRNTTGLVVDPYFSGTKVKWILDNVEGAREKAERGELLFGTVDTWLVWKLTQGRVHVTDYTNASRTMLFNIHTKKWDDKMLELLNIPRSMLPEVRNSSEVYGKTNIGGKGGVRIPVSGIAGDQQAALYGHLCTRAGQAKNTYGTGCFMLLHTGDKAITSKNGLLTTIACNAKGEPEYALEGSVFIAGASIQWLRDELKIVHDSYDSEYFVLEAMQSDSGQRLQYLRVDGGATNNNFLMQFQADILDVNVERPVVKEVTALGAAYLAGLAVGFWKDLDELHDKARVERTFTPDNDEEKRERRYKGWKKAVKRSLEWAKEDAE